MNKPSDEEGEEPAPVQYVFMLMFSNNFQNSYLMSVGSPRNFAFPKKFVYCAVYTEPTLYQDKKMRRKNTEIK